jgi:hypothetical protein
MPSKGTIERDHVFISYATEDALLADWLARKLGAMGYAVWYDRMKLLGGEPWPKDIDQAIKTRTFRMLGLLSRASIMKDNPSRERTTAQNVGRKLGIEDFLITLNVDGLAPTEIPWTLSEINYIPFSRSWAEGLAGVAKKLKSLNAPRVLPDGPALAIESYDSTRFIRREPERLCSNCLTIRQLPQVINRFTVASEFFNEETASLRGRWAYRRVSSDTLLAFHRPPEDIQKKFRIESAGGACWQCVPSLDKIDSRDLVVSLIHASIEVLIPKSW